MHYLVLVYHKKNPQNIEFSGSLDMNSFALDCESNFFLSFITNNLISLVSDC